MRRRKAAAHLGDGLRAGRQVGVVGAHHHDVVMVVGHAGADGAAAQQVVGSQRGWIGRENGPYLVILETAPFEQVLRDPLFAAVDGRGEEVAAERRDGDGDALGPLARVRVDPGALAVVAVAAPIVVIWKDVLSRRKLAVVPAAPRGTR